MKYTLFAILTGFAVSCAPSRFVEPLEEKQWSVGGGLGGPVIEFGGGVLPTPITTVEVGYGLKKNLTVYGALHTTAILFGTGQVDLGATYQLVEQNEFIPNVSVSPGFNFAFSPSSHVANFWPTLDANAFWHHGERKNYVYVGINTYYELASTRALGQTQQYHVLLNPQIGYVFRQKEHKWELFTEFKFLAPYVNNQSAFLPYKSLLGKNGATGFYLGFRKLIQPKNEQR